MSPRWGSDPRLAPVPTAGGVGGHAHREGQQRQYDAIRIGKVLQQRFVSADARVMIDVSRLGHTHDRMQQQSAIDFSAGAQHHFFMRAMQRIASLKGYDICTAQPHEFSRTCAGVRRSGRKS